ncbi:MAG: hypothetical protein IT258_15030, partial [Saprospiraceae bacterium]|nr:hypothetical protein [Saprospiraceae bacterium]
MKSAHTVLLLLLPWLLTAQSETFTPSGPGGGGYMYSPSISPHDPMQLYLTCDMAGVYRSNDGGQSWAMLHYNQLVSLVKGKVQFTSDPNILYSLSRSLTNPESPLFRAEIKRSTDGGDTWQPIPDPTGSGCHRLLADPNSTQRLLVNEYNRLFFSDNGGADWSVAYQPNDDQLWLGGAFWDGQNIYVGTGKGLLVSHDGGQSFALETHPGLPSGAGIFQLSGAKQGNTVRLFAIAAQTADLNAWMDVIDLKPSFIGIYKMNYNASAPWTDARGNIPDNFRLQWVDLATNNTNIVWAAGGNENDRPAIFKSTDGGQSWDNTFFPEGNQNVTTGWGGDGGPFNYHYGGAPLGLDISDNDPNHVLATDGYSHLTTDGGQTWRAIYVTPATSNPAGNLAPVDKFYQSSGLDVTTGHHLLFLGIDEVFAGCTDIGNQYSTDGGDTWSFARNLFFPWGNVAFNNWYMLLQHPENPSELYGAVAEINDMYHGRITDASMEGADGMVLHSTDRGLTWDTLHDFNHPVVWLAQDEDDPQRLFASVVHHEEGGIFRSLDGGQTWTKLELPARTEGHPYNIRLLRNGGVVVTFSARALEDGVTLTPSSGVFYSPDGGDTWLDRTAPSMMYYTKDLIIDPLDFGQNTWYATVWGRFTTFPGPNNEGNGGLYRTRDRGLTWERIFAHERTESATIFPALPWIMYLTVEMEGLFYTNNLNEAAPDFTRVEAFPFPRPKRVFFNPYTAGDVWVTTRGGATWRGREEALPVDEVKSKHGQAFELNIAP